jgi:mono/diheme cytochrome c family protein
MVGNPRTGLEVFRKSGCAKCHAVNGVGHGEGPDLGFEREPNSTLNQLVAAMWNHAPRMWQRMQTKGVS